MANNEYLNDDKITRLVEECLGEAIGTTPFTRVSAYLASLKDEGLCTDAQLIEIQTRVIRVLMNRIFPQNPAPPKD